MLHSGGYERRWVHSNRNNISICFSGACAHEEQPTCPHEFHPNLVSQFLPSEAITFSSSLISGASISIAWGRKWAEYLSDLNRRGRKKQQNIRRIEGVRLRYRNLILASMLPLMRFIQPSRINLLSFIPHSAFSIPVVRS